MRKITKAPEVFLPAKGLYPVQFYTGQAASTCRRVNFGADSFKEIV